MDVLLGVFQVDLPMGDVQVAAIDHRFFRIQRAQISAQIILPLHAVGQARQFILAVGRIDVDEEELLELQRDGAALVAVLLFADAVAHGERFHAGENGCAGIPLFLGAVPVLVVARRRKFGLARLHLRFLKADDVRAEALEDVREAFAEDGPETIDIPRYQFQNDIPRIFLSKFGTFRPGYCTV